MNLLAFQRVILFTLIFPLLLVIPVTAQVSKKCSSHLSTGGPGQTFSGMGMSQFASGSSSSTSIPFAQTSTLQTPFLQGSGTPTNFRKCSRTQTSTMQGGFQSPYSPGGGMQIPFTQNGGLQTPLTQTSGFQMPLQMRSMLLPLNQGYGVPISFNQAITQQISTGQLADFQSVLMQGNRKNLTCQNYYSSQQNITQNGEQPTINSRDNIVSTTPDGIPIFSDTNSSTTPSTNQNYQPLFGR